MRSRLFAAAVFAAVMAGAVAAAAAWRPQTYIADSRPAVKLEAVVPSSFGDWQVDPTIVPIQPSPDLQSVLDRTYDQTLARTYRNGLGKRVMLSIAYGRNQNEGMNTHRPEICYPAQGLSIVRGAQINDMEFEGGALKVTTLVAAQGARNEPITYWLRVGDELTTFGSGHKLATLRYGLRGKIPDGLLVRVSSIDADNVAAFALQQAFIRDMLHAMTREQRRLALGDRFGA